MFAVEYMMLAIPHPWSRARTSGTLSLFLFPPPLLLAGGSAAGLNVNTWLLREKMRNNVHVFMRDVSTYGTYVNGQKIGRYAAPRLLKHGEVSCLFVFLFLVLHFGSR